MSKIKIYIESYGIYIHCESPKVCKELAKRIIKIINKFSKTPIQVHEIIAGKTKKKKSYEKNIWRKKNEIKNLFIV